jgi:hypothetical protein
MLRDEMLYQASFTPVLRDNRNNVPSATADLVEDKWTEMLDTA